MAAPHDLVELSKHLKQERLFITSERDQLHSLNENIGRSSERLFHLAWVAQQQKITLDQLILGCRQVTPEVCFQQSNAAETVTFIDGYKYLSYHESKVGEFLKYLRENPKVVAICLLEAEKAGSETLQKISQVVVSGIYGHAIMLEDEAYLLQVLKSLIELQVANNENPRRLLRRGSCAFSIIFKLLNEGLFSAKLFLTAALHKPVMQLLMDVEWFYDIDPDRALSRFPPSERLRRYGQPGTKEYTKKTRQYRELMVKKLVTLAEQFRSSIKNNMFCFPQSLAWLVSHLYQTVTKAQRIEPAEVRAICADLVLTFFICPAICDPEPFGITSDAPISYIARHNLMQVAQMLQVLASGAGSTDGDPKCRDLYSEFETGCMSFLLDLLLESPASTQPPALSVQLTGCCRAASLLTATQLVEIVTLARTLSNALEEDSLESKQLENLLSHLPSLNVLQHGSISSHNTPNSTPQATPPGTPSSIQKLNKSLRDKKRLFLTPEPPAPSDGSDDVDCLQVAAPEEVLVVSLGVINECPGMLPENKVLEQESKPRKFNSLLPGEDDPISESDIPLHEKRTRFSLSHDQDSIATSDNLEAISEAASSHSVGSDDLEDNENDNLSDMVSANVSGRGTPNISGRDTPLSTAESAVEAVEDRGAPNLPIIVQKTNREDVTDRFGKFDIKQELERDETKSTVSDTWSTDVLASDSEPPEQTQYERLSEVAEEMARQNLLGVVEVSELSETTSDAWSVDVLASDTSERQMDRLLELDQDDVCSISSRSQAQDEMSEQGDVDAGEDTPEPPGRQSPNYPGKSSDTDSLPTGASAASKSSSRMGGATASGGLPDYHGNISDRRKPPSDRYSDSSSDRGRLPEFGILKNGDDVRRKTNSLNPFNSYDNNYRMAGSNNELSRPDFKYDSGVDSVDGLLSRGGEGSRSNSQAFKERNSTGGAIPRNYSGGFVDGRSTGVNTNLLFFGQSTAFVKPSSISRSDPKDLAGSVESLGSDLNDGLKITEQQNIKIEASRLSAVVDIFDPLSQENNNNDPNIDNKTLFLDNPDETCNLNFKELGTRPKIPNCDIPPLPRIALGQENLDGCPQNSSNHNENLVTRPKDKYAYMEPGVEPLLGENYCASYPSSGFPPQNGDILCKSSDGQGDAGGATLVDIPVITSKIPQSEARNLEELKEEERKQDGKKKAGLLHIFKEKWNKGSKRKVNKEKDDPDGSTRSSRALNGPPDGDDFSNHSDRFGAGEFSRPKSDDPFPPATESTDDILDKYRRSSPLKTANDISLFNSASLTPANQSKEKGVSWDEEEDGSQSCDSVFENRKTFLDAKKKLRLVLSTADFQAIPSFTSFYGSSNPFRSQSNKKENDLVSFLRVQLAEAINLQDKDLVAQLHETIRCLTPFDNNEIKKLLKTMRDEYRTRAPYISYLVRCRQGLLSTHSHLDRLHNRIQRNKSMCNKYFISVLVRLFLERRERQFGKFIEEFQRLTVSDEKTDLVERFLYSLNRYMEDDLVWRAATGQQIEEAHRCVEWNVMSRVYVDAMYPNGDGDILRDQILRENIQKLAQEITPNHRDIRIPRIYHYECPWPAAQAEIYMINAYKTPKDKVQCVMRCSTTIMNLLSMANEKSVPAADDFTPVLIYVLIKSNPQSLLSTVQYVNSFYAKRMDGEEQYWWMQFQSAIEFIKTMIMGIDEGVTNA